MKYYLYNYILSLAFVNKNFVTINYILNQGTILLFISGGDAYRLHRNDLNFLFNSIKK